jgi:hypothetical protein
MDGLLNIPGQEPTTGRKSGMQEFGMKLNRFKKSMRKTLTNDITRDDEEEETYFF